MLIALIGTLTALMTLPALAVADTAFITFADTAGKDDPVSGVGRIMTIAGNTPTPKKLYVKVRAPGGAPCAPSADTDTGAALDQNGESIYVGSSQYPQGADFYGVSVDGDFAIRRAGRWISGAGTYMFCYWLAGGSNEPVPAITQTITFRASVGTISVTVSPGTIRPDEHVTVTLNGTSESSAYAYARVRLGGAPCGAVPASDSGTTEGTVGGDVNGAFSITSRVLMEETGTYQVCAWLLGSSSVSSATQAIAGPQPATFSVVVPPPPLPPPPPCIVPSINPGSAFADVQSVLQTAGCTAGRRRYTTSKRYPRGTVIKLDSTSGTTLLSQAPVGMLVSSGAPCVVPRVGRNWRLATARRQLTAAGCTPGKVSRARSRRRTGTVIRFTPKAGTRLSSRAVVRIVVDRR